MQRILWAFILLSPLIAFAQSYHWPAFASGHGALAQHMVAQLSQTAAGFVHKVQTLAG